MKKLYFLALAASVMTFTGCSDDINFGNEGEGSVVISASYNSDVKVNSRAAASDELSESTIVWISSPKGLVRKFEGLNSMPADGIKLVAGNYVAEAWAGDSVSASFESRYFKGRQEFSISNGVTRVDLECKIANVVAAVEYSAAIDNVLSDYTLTIGHKRGELTFEGRDDRRGYFMMPNGVSNLTWKLTGTQNDGSTFTKEGTINNVEAAILYTVSVKYNGNSGSDEEIGAGFITIEIDDTTIDVNDQITVSVAPTITGYGYDMQQPISAEPGKVGRKSVYVTAATALTGMVISSDDFVSILGVNEIDLMRANASVLANLEAKGITYQYAYNEQYDISNLKVNFDETFTNSLSAGVHTIAFAATDGNEKTSTATLKLNLTDADLEADEIPANSPAIWASKVRLTGRLLKDKVSNPGFQIRQVGDIAWEYVPAEVADRAGVTIFADVDGLTPATDYQYRVVCDGFESADIKSFTTAAAPQLPNASFEDWGKSTRAKTPVIPSLNDASLFWDSGNHGSATMGVTLTQKSTDYVKSGDYSAKLRSQFVGIGIAGKFAAGNIFVGQYLYTDGTDGVLGWGREFSGRPTKLTLWAKYEPGTVDKNGKGSHLSQGDLDKGKIYVALMDDNKYAYSNSKSDCDNTSWPFIVQTKAANRQLFDSNDEHVIGYAEIVLDKATEGDGLVNLSVDINYFRTDVIPSNVIFVASASMYGDYFEGGEGSTLYLDDIEFVY
ncbi:MAG: DUF4493 domain-containing protein [Muribaculaceae bacterium]|nr:DUF4493 domain-containing protein [Muribaculaceae bacterium]